VLTKSIRAQTLLKTTWDCLGNQVCADPGCVAPQARGSWCKSKQAPRPRQVISTGTTAARRTLLPRSRALRNACTDSRAPDPDSLPRQPAAQSARRSRQVTARARAAAPCSAAGKRRPGAHTKVHLIRRRCLFRATRRRGGSGGPARTPNSVAGAELLGSIASKELKNGAEGAACAPAALGQPARRRPAQQPFRPPASPGLGWLPVLCARRNKLVVHGPTPLACASLRA